ncbi:Cupredoxin, partial [Armillaria mellea]
TGELAYNPEYVTASAGDTINFIFNPKNHTVTQSSFNAPCAHHASGVDSGFTPVNADQADLPTFQLLVNDTNPVWVYCRQTGHCGKGMVFAVNPGAEGSSNSFSAFKALAISSNGTTSSSSATFTYTTPPAPSWTTVTATVTSETSAWLTTYASYDDHKIVVGIDGNLEYSPANISASIGDTVTFEFHPKNHTVTQSSFQHPCQPLAETSTSGEIGFSSGFRPFAADATEFPTFQIKINDTAPVWGYCGQTNHCGSGMVFSINAVETGTNNFAAFKELAIHTNGTATGSSSGN